MVTLLLNGSSSFETEPGNLLVRLRALPEQLLSDTPCGGRGTCGKCRVALDASNGEVSPLTEAEIRYLASVKEAPPEGYVWRLACMCEVISGTISLLPVSKPHQISGIGLGSSAAYQTGHALPVWHDVILSYPSADSPQTTESQLKNAVPGCAFSFAQMEQVSDILEAHHGDKEIPVRVSVINGEAVYIGESKVKLYGAAIDVGTTTVAVSLIGEDGVAAAENVISNPTRAWGGDVLSRITHCQQHPEDQVRMTQLMRGAIDEILKTMVKEKGIDPAHVVCQIVAGNSVMEHMFAGVSPIPIGRAPFYMQTSFGKWYYFSDCFIPRTYLAPLAASYVGGDVLMGAAYLLWSKPERKNVPFLFLDLGTNGELGIYKEGHWQFAAAAAGPAFEGAHMDKGMPAIPGAAAQISVEDDHFAIKTVGDREPVGFCGSGILDGIACMMELEVLDCYGGMSEDVETPLREGLGVTEDDDDGAKCTFAPDLYLSQHDIRMMQTAKSAIRSGADVLVERQSLEVTDLDAVYLAGSFGSMLRPASAAAIGLIWPEMEESVYAIGNTSLRGAAAYFCDRTFSEILKTVCDNSDYIELSTEPGFSDRFIENMCFGAEDF